MGNYLSEDYAHLLMEGDFRSSKFGLVAFGGIGCQFGDDISGNDINVWSIPFRQWGRDFLHGEGGGSVLIRWNRQGEK